MRCVSLLQKRIFRSDSPRVIGPWIESFPSRPSSRPVSPEISPDSANQSAFSYVQAPARDAHVRRTDSRRRVDDAESTAWTEPPRSPRMPLSPLSREPPDTWWMPCDDDQQRRPAQPKAVSELRAELRAQLPWSYFQVFNIPFLFSNFQVFDLPFSFVGCDGPLQRISSLYSF